MGVDPGSMCEHGVPHDYTVEVEMPTEDRPTYVVSKVTDRYCSACGVKQTLRERMLAEGLEDPTPSLGPKRHPR